MNPKYNDLAAVSDRVETFRNSIMFHKGEKWVSTLDGDVWFIYCDEDLEMHLDDTVAYMMEN